MFGLKPLGNSDSGLGPSAALSDDDDDCLTNANAPKHEDVTMIMMVITASSSSLRLLGRMRSVNMKRQTHTK